MSEYYLFQFYCVRVRGTECYGMRAVSAYLGELILLLFSPYNLEQIISTIKVHKKSEKFMLGPFQFYSSKFSFSIVARAKEGGRGAKHEGSSIFTLIL